MQKTERRESRRDRRRLLRELDLFSSIPDEKVREEFVIVIDFLHEYSEAVVDRLVELMKSGPRTFECLDRNLESLGVPHSVREQLHDRLIEAFANGEIGDELVKIQRSVPPPIPRQIVRRRRRRELGKARIVVALAATVLLTSLVVLYLYRAELKTAKQMVQDIMIHGIDQEIDAPLVPEPPPSFTSQYYLAILDRSLEEPAAPKVVATFEKAVQIPEPVSTLGEEKPKPKVKAETKTERGGKSKRRLLGRVE